MTRLIDAEALERSIKSWYCDPGKCNNYDGVMCRACRIDDALSEIDRAPTVDAIPVEWLREMMINADDNADTEMASAISWLIQTWQKEQEAKHEQAD